MHKFERFGRTSDRGTPIHPYRTTHITHTHGDFLGSTSLPRLFSHSYGLPGLRLIVFLFHLLDLLLSTYTNPAGMGVLGINCAPDWTGLAWMDRYIYQDFAIRPGISSQVERRFTYLVWLGLGSVQRCRYCPPRFLVSSSLDFRLSPVSYVASDVIIYIAVYRDDPCCTVP